MLTRLLGQTIDEDSLSASNNRVSDSLVRTAMLPLGQHRAACQAYTASAPPHQIVVANGLLRFRVSLCVR